MRIKNLLALLLTLCLVVGTAVVPASAKTVTDAHGNEIELDDTLAGYSEVDLLGGDAARAGETNLGDFWADALLWFAQSGKIAEYYDEDDVAIGNTGISEDVAGIVALWNAGNLKADLAAGKFGAEEVMAVLPYPNKVAVVYMTGAQLLEALEAASQGLPCTEETYSAAAALMQIAGAEYTVAVDTAFDAGEAYGNSWFKANSIKRTEITSVGGQAFDAEATYAVITSNANFNGMDSSYMFKAAAAENENSTITTAVVRDVVWMYIEEELGSVIPADYAEAQGRITLVTGVQNDAADTTETEGTAEDAADAPAEDAAEAPETADGTDADKTDETPADKADEAADATENTDAAAGEKEVAEKPAAVYYTVVKGDCLWKIAARYYGAGRRWTEIYAANKALIKNPDLIYVGQVFVIPGIE